MRVCILGFTGRALLPRAAACCRVLPRAAACCRVRCDAQRSKTTRANATPKALTANTEVSDHPTNSQFKRDATPKALTDERSAQGDRRRFRADEGCSRRTELGHRM